jgi:hypothetical protein
VGNGFGGLGYGLRRPGLSKRIQSILSLGGEPRRTECGPPRNSFGSGEFESPTAHRFRSLSRLDFARVKPSLDQSWPFHLRDVRDRLGDTCHSARGWQPLHVRRKSAKGLADHMLTYHHIRTIANSATRYDTRTGWVPVGPGRRITHTHRHRQMRHSTTRASASPV